MTQIHAAARPKVIDVKSGQFIIFSEHDHLADHLIRKGIWEEHTQTLMTILMEHSAGDVLDIGANMGAITIPMARARPNHTFYCFEAQRHVYYQLCGNIALNQLFNVHPFHMAIGNPAGMNEVINVPVPDYTLDANVGAVTLDNRVNTANNWTYPAHEAVPILKIDDLGLQNIGVIKIDVEGMELDVLRGMQDTLKRSDYPNIIFEIWRDGKYDWVEAERNEAVKLLRDMGYKVDLYQTITTAIAQHTSRHVVELNIEVNKS